MEMGFNFQMDVTIYNNYCIEISTKLIQPNVSSNFVWFLKNWINLILEIFKNKMAEKLFANIQLDDARSFL